MYLHILRIIEKMISLSYIFYKIEITFQQAGNSKQNYLIALILYLLSKPVDSSF